MVNDYKYLGVWIDSQLSFAKHVKNTIKNVSFRISKLSKIHNSLTQKTALLLYKAMILPLYDNGDLFYHFACQKSLLQRLQTLQNNAVRIICKLPKRTNVLEEQRNLGLAGLSERRLLHSMQFAQILSLTSSNLDPGSTRRSILTRAMNPRRRQL